MRIEDYCDLADGGLVLKKGLRHYIRKNVLTDNSVMKQQLDMLDRSGQSSLPLSILGEKGCGKDIIAKYACLVSNRCTEPFLAINCAYLTEEQIVRELFGIRGSRAEGMLNRASGGTLYIQNADLLSSQTQYQLINHITSAQGSASNVRYFLGLNHSGNQDANLIDSFAFYFNTMTFEIPPLRERPEDILLLCLQRLHDIKQESQIERVLSPEVLTAMLSYDWPGNIRQLINTIDRMVFFCDTVLIDSVSLFQKGLSSTKKIELSNPKPMPFTQEKSLKEIVSEYEVMIINQYIDEHGSLRKAAAALKTCPSVLSTKLTKYYATHSSRPAPSK